MTTASDAPADNSSAPLLLAIEPTVFVTDLPRSLAFYVETLGFEVALIYGEPPFFGVVARDAASLNLRLAPQPAIDRSQGPDLLSASITVSHARQLFLEFRGRGAPFHQTLRREPWHGQGEGAFIVADPDGNLLLFGGRTD